MEHAPTAYLEDLLATNIKRMERDIANTREQFSVDTGSTGVPLILRGLSQEEWGVTRSIIDEALRSSGRLTESVKIPLLYLAAESWDTVFWTIEHAWREELELEEPLIQSYCEEIKTLVLQTLPCMLQPHRLQELALQHEQQMGKIFDAGQLFRAIQRIREESDQRSTAIRRWCSLSVHSTESTGE